MYYLLPLLLTYFSLSLCIALKEINLRFKLNNNFFWFSSRRLKYICMNFFTFSLHPPPPHNSLLYMRLFQSHFILIFTDLIWHGLVFSWQSDVRSCQLWFNFLKKKFQIQLCFVVATVMSFIYSTKIFISLCLCGTK